MISESVKNHSVFFCARTCIFVTASAMTTLMIMCVNIHRVHSLFHQSLPRSPTAPEFDINGPDDNISYAESVFDPNRGMYQC